MDEKNTEIICTPRGGFLLFNTIIVNIAMVLSFVIVLLDESKESIVVKSGIILVFTLIGLGFDLTYINRKVVLTKQCIYNFNLFGISKKYDISDIQDESSIGGRGRKLIFYRGSVVIYSYYKNYEEADAYITKYKIGQK